MRGLHGAQSETAVLICLGLFGLPTVQIVLMVQLDVCSHKLPIVAKTPNFSLSHARCADTPPYSR